MAMVSADVASPPVGIYPLEFIIAVGVIYLEQVSTV